MEFAALFDGIHWTRRGATKRLLRPGAAAQILTDEPRQRDLQSLLRHLLGKRQPMTALR